MNWLKRYTKKVHLIQLMHHLGKEINLVTTCNTFETSGETKECDHNGYLLLGLLDQIIKKKDEIRKLNSWLQKCINCLKGDPGSVILEAEIIRITV
jgi:hypothetical protein